MVESVQLQGKGRICASIEKLFEWVQEKGPIDVSTEKWSNPCKYREKVESVRVSKNCSGGYQEKGPINVSTEKWKNPGEYQEKV